MLKVEKRFTLVCFFENKVHFYPLFVCLWDVAKMIITSIDSMRVLVANLKPNKQVQIPTEDNKCQ